jgi:argininosuccinate synthase
MERVILAYSGGLDTSVAIPWLAEKYDAEVVAVTLDLGQGKELDDVRERAMAVGAIRCHVLDVRTEFADEYVLPALQAGALYEGQYPLATALGRPLITQKLVEIAEFENAGIIAHGCTGKGNDQVRFDVSVHALAPELQVIAPVREWGLTRDQEEAYAKEHGIPVPEGSRQPYSLDQNLWGRSIESGPLEDPWVEPPEDAYEWTVAPENAPDTPAYVEIGFEEGIPITLNGQEKNGLDLIQDLNDLGGAHGVGRVDHVENRVVGIKSREIYECPAGTILFKAHEALEQMTLARDQSHFKRVVAEEISRLVYGGLWFSTLNRDLMAFVDSTQRAVSGTVRVKLYRGQATVVGRQSPHSLYREDLATYLSGDAFDHRAAEGFVKIWGLSTQVQARQQIHGNDAPLLPQAKRLEAKEAEDE